MDYCDYCHGDGWRITNIGNKPVKCDECCGTGRANGAYTSIPKENGWNLWRLIEFVAAVIVLIVVGFIMTPSLVYRAIKDSEWFYYVTAIGYPVSAVVGYYTMPWYWSLWPDGVGKILFIASVSFFVVIVLLNIIIKLNEEPPKTCSEQNNPDSHS